MRLLSALSSPRAEGLHPEEEAGWDLWHFGRHRHHAFTPATLQDLDTNSQINFFKYKGSSVYGSQSCAWRQSKKRTMSLMHRLRLKRLEIFFQWQFLM